MADQLLSQADVDALIASLTQSEDITSAAPAKEEAPKKTMPVDSKKPETPKPAAAPAPKASAPVPQPVAEKPVQNNPSVGGTPVNKMETQTTKNDAVIEKLSDKIDELAAKVEQFSSLSRKVDLIEKRLMALESTVNMNRGNAEVENKVNALVEEVKKINIGLKGTPGYAVKHKFTCEKCEDHGHVAIKYRCTKCGHEKWYGWWPKK